MALVMGRAMRALPRKMEADTAHLPIGNILLIWRSRAVWAALLLIIFWTGPLFSQASAQERDVVLPESGIHYPGGFDPNTVGEVQGKAYGYSQPSSGPIQFRLDSGKETYVVLGSPAWYWNDLGAKIPDGTEVRVRGSKSLGRDGNLYLIAQEMQVLSSGKSYAFRDEDGYPIWKGPRRGPMGSQGGFGSPQRGMGGGAGGVGRGKR